MIQRYTAILAEGGGKRSVHRLPVFVWSHARDFLENAGQMVGIFESELVCHLAHVHDLFGNQFFRAPYDIELYVFLRCLAELFLYEITELIGREACFRRAHLHRRQPPFPGFARFEPIPDGFLKSAEDSTVGHLARDELPVIETGTVIQHSLYRRGHYLLRMFVDSMLEFCPVETLCRDCTDAALCLPLIVDFVNSNNKENIIQ